MRMIDQFRKLPVIAVLVATMGATAIAKEAHQLVAQGN